ncbi:MAG: hypothetical protein Fur0034_04480 [Desulfuromonadia bacterium]
MLAGRGGDAGRVAQEQRKRRKRSGKKRMGPRLSVDATGGGIGVAIGMIFG